MNSAAALGTLLKEELESQGGVWRPVDFEDITISLQAFEAVKKAARDILPTVIPREDLKKISVADSISLLTRHLFWDESSGNLSLCANLGERKYCLRIPPGHWGLKDSDVVH
jgi:hypothetical protein